jgi:hypothetical protein
MSRFLTSTAVWLTAYVAALVGIGLVVLHLRDTTLTDLSSPENIENWQAWRAAAAKQDGTSGPVQRTVPKSTEPPMLVLMRDHFPVMLTASIVFPAILLGFLMLAARGVLRESAERRGAKSTALHEQHINSTTR